MCVPEIDPLPCVLMLLKCVPVLRVLLPCLCDPVLRGPLPYVRFCSCPALCVHVPALIFIRGSNCVPELRMLLAYLCSCSRSAPSLCVFLIRSAKCVPAPTVLLPSALSKIQRDEF